MVSPVNFHCVSKCSDARVCACHAGSGWTRGAVCVRPSVLQDLKPGVWISGSFWWGK